jgi:hypothetical protein
MDYPDHHTVSALIERLGWFVVELPGASGLGGMARLTAMPLAELQRARGAEDGAETSGGKPGSPVPRLEGVGATRDEALYKLYRAICSYTGNSPEV